MRAENGNDIALASTLSTDSEDALLPSSSFVAGQESHKELTVAVTTAPRKDCTLAYCLASIEACGWDPIVFAEPGSTETEYRTVWNEAKLGIWHNWLNSCRWCLEQTSSEYIMTVQDDSLFHPDSKQLVDFLTWPDNCGFVSLYTPKHYSIRADNTLRPLGVNKIVTKSLWGACALVWHRDVLRKVIDTPTCKYWLGAKPKSGSKSVIENRKNNPSSIANSDTAIGKAINRLGLFMYFVDPSPVHHISKYSTISHGDNTGRRNCYRCADFEKPLISQVFK
jgi:hypothetical protein